MSKQRLEYLDGLRGLAILWVILYHFLSRWAELVPFGSTYQQWPIFEMGYLGVNLFFLISGFVIFMTLERCDNLLGYLYKRWLRLFPAMLLASLLIFTTAFWLPERPQGMPQAINLVSGLFFIDPYWLARATGWTFGSLEGAFWSLYIEFKFYVVAGILFFRFGAKVAWLSLGAMYLLWLVCGHLLTADFVDGLSTSFKLPLNLVHTLLHELGAKYYGWFFAGAGLYLYHQKPQRRLLLATTVMIVIASADVAAGQHRVLISALLVSCWMLACVLWQPCQHLMTGRFWWFFGFISYPLYLIHENMGVALLIKLQKWHPLSYSELYVPLVMLLVSMLAWIIARYSEVPLRRILQSAFTKLASRQ